MIERRYYGEFGGAFIPEILVSTARAFKGATDLRTDDIILINLSGRGDKDIFAVADAFCDPQWNKFIQKKAEETGA